MEIILVRHGEPGLGDGPEVDPDLGERGRSQAEAVAARLAGAEVSRVYVSPLRRARSTAAPIESRTGAPLEVLDGLAEADAYTPRRAYLRVETLRKDHVALGRFLADPFAFLGADREAFSTAVRGAFDRIARDAAGPRVVAVTHGLPHNLLLADILGLESVTAFAPSYCAISRVHVGEHGRRILSVNETGHLG